MRLDRTKALLLVIDVQERLFPVIDGHEELQRNVERIVRGCHILGVPAVLTEQYVKGLGPTVARVRKVFEGTSGYAPIEKSCFSAYGCAPFEEALRKSGRTQILVAGVETHVCVYQTVKDLVANGFEVTLIADALSSRTPQNREIALMRMQSDGAKWSSTEMALFELMVNSGTEEFRAISPLLK